MTRKSLPADFDQALWLDPLSFQGLIGRVIASSKVDYSSLFREDGFAKPLADLRADPNIAKLLPQDQPHDADRLKIAETFTCSACETGPWHNSWSPEFNPPLCPNCSGAD